MFLGWVLTLKLWTVWQTNDHVVYWYFMNIISIFCKLLVVLKYYWNLSVTSVKFSSRYKILFSILTICTCVMCFPGSMSVLGVSLIMLPIYRVTSPKTSIVGVRVGIFKRNLPFAGGLLFSDCGWIAFCSVRLGTHYQWSQAVNAALVPVNMAREHRRGHECG